MIFYTPIDWTESSKKTKRKVTQQIAVETHAKSKKIEIIWKGAWFFESEFVSEKNEIIARYFFRSDNSTLDLIESFKEHGERLLEEIGTSIDFKGKDIEIDQKETIEKLTQSETKVTILSGVGGVGKTAVIKKVHQNLDPKITLLYF